MIILYLVFALISHSVCQQQPISEGIASYLPRPVIGAYFDEKDASLRQSFLLAVRTVNKCMYDDEVCEIIQPTPVTSINRQLFHQVEFNAITVDADEDTISLYRKFGELAGVIEDEDAAVAAGLPTNDNGLAVVIGPHAHIPSLYIQGLCELQDIPQIIIRRELDFQHDPVRSLNFYPDTETLAKVYIEMLGKLNWTDFSILYERTENFLALDNVLKMYPMHTHNVYAYKLGRGPDFSEQLLKAKATKHKSFLIDCGFNILSDVLKQAQQIGMMTESYEYVVTTLDLHAVNLRPYQYSGANISGLQLVDVDDPFVRKFVSSNLEEFGIGSVEQLRVKDAAIFDAVVAFAQAFKDLNYQYQMFQGARLHKEYRKPTPWKDGLSLRNYILAVEMNGLTGPVMLDGDGVRRRFKLDVVNLHQAGLQRVGQWSFEDGFGDLNLKKVKRRAHYKVLITLVKPYASEVNDSSSLEGNARYEGFVVDLIMKLSELMNFDYTFYVQEDKSNGNCTKDERTTQCVCSGMMGKILNNEMDMAITDLTVTEDRENCVGFSTSVLMLGISILFKKPQKAEASWNSFFAPFNYQVWLYIVFTYFAMGALFYAFGRLCPNEWTNPYPCIEEPDHLENQFTINNALWFTMGSKMQQGSEIAPKGYSTRILAGWWWFFCLIIVNTYLANLVAFLTVETPVKLISKIDDLFDQTEIKYGAKRGGSTLKFFESSSNPHYRALYEQMRDPDWEEKYLVDENDCGVKMANRTDINYAFFMESTSIEYAVNRYCNLQQTGDLLDQKSYAIAYAKNFSLDQEIKTTIVKLQESLIIKEIKDKWWNMKGATCGKDDPNMPMSLTLEQMKGIFYVLGVGTLLTFFQTVFEFVQSIRAITKTTKIGFWKVAIMELRILAKSKPIKPVLSNQISLEAVSVDGYSNQLLA